MLNIVYSMENEIKVLKLYGRLTSENLNIFKNYFEQTKDENSFYLFDFEKLEFIDSIGLGYVIQTLKYVMAQGGELKIIHLESQPKVIFEITRVESIFEIYNDKEKALNSFTKREAKNASGDTSRQRAL